MKSASRAKTSPSTNLPVPLQPNFYFLLLRRRKRAGGMWALSLALATTPLVLNIGGIVYTSANHVVTYESPCHHSGLCDMI